MLSHALRAEVQNSTIPSPTDPNFKQVSLLLHGDGTNGAQNNTFIGEVSPAQYYGTFNGSTQYLSVPASSNLQFGTGDFTLECYCYFTSFSGYQVFFNQGFVTAGGYVLIVGADNGIPYLYSNGAAQQASSGFSLNTWNHFAVCRQGTSLSMFINGSRVGNFTNTANINLNTSLEIGAATSAYYFPGRLSNCRIIKGVSAYNVSATSITPPTGNLTAISGTQLLTLQNATIVDNSTNNFTITNNGSVAMTDQYPTVTRNGNTTQGTNTPFSQAAGYWSNNTTSGTFTVPDNTAFAFGSGDFTIEMWAYLSASIPSGTLTKGVSGEFMPFTFYFGGSELAFYSSSNGTSWDIASNRQFVSPVPRDVWNHYAVTRSGTTFRTFYNGVVTNTWTSSASLFVNSSSVTVGKFGNNWQGYISNLRIVKGTAVYTAAFTPPTTPLTAITNTSLLTCQSNNFKDNSSNNFAVTATGTPSVQPFSPFAPTAAYSTSVNGGSMYFDGTGDNLTFPSGAAFQFGTGDFTVESWAYLTSAPTAQYIIDARNSGQTTNWAFGWGLSGTNGILSFFNGSTTLDEASTSVTANTWAHCVAVRSGTTLSIFVNGVRVATTTNSTNFSISPTTSYIGSRYTDTVYMTGYLSNVRTVKGTAVYDPTLTTLTVPTAPLTAITNTSLLLNGTNAGIFDNAIKNNLETVGNAQVSTAVTKFGTGSMKFDSGGGGGYLIIPTSNNFTFGTGNFTIEFWVYSNSTQSALFYDSRPLSTNGIYPTLYTNADNTVRLFVNSVDVITSSAVLTNNTWHHVAVCRSGTSTKLFINGTQSGSTYTDTNNYLNGANRPVIGTQGVTLGASVLNGYIDDLRVTKGVARYTANFTPPTAAFPNQ